MPVNMDLAKAGLAATGAAEALAQATKVTPAAMRLNVADHATILEELRLAVMLIHWGSAVLPTVLKSIKKKRERYRQSKSGTGRELADGLDTLYDSTSRAETQARPANLDPAFQRARVDVRQLSIDGSPAAQPAPRRGRLIIRSVKQTSETLSVFVAEMSPGDGPVEDLADALGSTADLTLAMVTICRQEATLVDAAYESARIPRSAAAVSDTLRTTADALSDVHATVSDASELAKQLAALERQLLTAV